MDGHGSQASPRRLSILPSSPGAGISHRRPVRFPTKAPFLGKHLGALTPPRRNGVGIPLFPARLSAFEILASTTPRTSSIPSQGRGPSGGRHLIADMCDGTENALPVTYSER